MKRKLNEKYVYYGIMLFVVAIFLVIMFSERKKRETELDIESKLPKIQQEETQSKAQTEERGELVAQRGACKTWPLVGTWVGDQERRLTHRQAVIFFKGDFV